MDHDRRTFLKTSSIVGMAAMVAVLAAATPQASAADLLKQLGLATGAPYERDALNERIEKYLSGVRSHGYYEAKIAPAVSLADGDRVANLTVAVDRGAHVRVVFAGDPLPANRHADLVPVERDGAGRIDRGFSRTVQIGDVRDVEVFRNCLVQLDCEGLAAQHQVVQ